MGVGAYPAAPRIGFPISDVRDVAVTHALAMTHPKAAGQRFLSANGFLRLIEVGRLMVEVLPDLKSKAPKFEMHDFVVRALSVVDRRLKAVLPDLGNPRPVSNAKAHSVLGQSFRSPQRRSNRLPRAEAPKASRRVAVVHLCGLAARKICARIVAAGGRRVAEAFGSGVWMRRHLRQQHARAENQRRTMS
jgi:hypothetical protein